MAADTEFDRRFARLISTIFVPPSFTILVFFYFGAELENSLSGFIRVFITALLFGFIMPIVLFIYLRKKGRIIDIDATVKEERTFPFLIAVLFYTAGLFFLIYFNAHIISTAFWFCYISNTVLTVFINRYWKISAHAMGAAGPAAAVSFVSFELFILLLVILLIVGWARIKLKCHSVPQVLAGAFIGFTSTLIQIIYILEYYSYA